jgi:hypothetical protein
VKPIDFWFQLHLLCSWIHYKKIHGDIFSQWVIGQGKICNSLKSKIFSKSFLSHIERKKKKILEKKIFRLAWSIKDLWGTKVMYCYVVKWSFFCLQRGNFQKNQEFSQKWKFFKILPVPYWKKPEFKYPTKIEMAFSQMVAVRSSELQ